MEGASVLNPFTLKTLSLEQARNLVPLLKYFGFKHFTEQFLGKLKTQMSSLIEAANSNTTGIPLRELPNTTFLFLRLVGLVQVLSASVERLFSQLKLVVNAVGHSQLEETLEARLFVQENMLPNGCGLPRS